MEYKNIDGKKQLHTINQYSFTALNQMNIIDFRKVPPYYISRFDATKYKMFKEELLKKLTFEQICQFTQNQLNHFPICVLEEYLNQFKNLCTLTIDDFYTEEAYTKYKDENKICIYISEDKYTYITQKESIVQMVKKAIQYQTEMEIKKNYANIYLHPNTLEFCELQNSIKSSIVQNLLNVTKVWINNRIKEGDILEIPNTKPKLLEYNSIVKYLNNNYINNSKNKTIQSLERLYKFSEIISMFPDIISESLLRYDYMHNGLPYIKLSERVYVFRLEDIKDFYAIKTE